MRGCKTFVGSIEHQCYFPASVKLPLSVGQSPGQRLPSSSAQDENTRRGDHGGGDEAQRRLCRAPGQHMGHVARPGDGEGPYACVLSAPRRCYRFSGIAKEIDGDDVPFGLRYRH